MTSQGDEVPLGGAEAPGRGTPRSACLGTASVTAQRGLVTEPHTRASPQFRRLEARGQGAARSGPARAPWSPGLGQRLPLGPHTRREREVSLFLFLGGP